MPSIAIVTDTHASLPADVAAQHHIWLVPISIHFGAHSFDTGIDIDDAQLFERVNREGKLATTAAPTAGRFATAYQAAFDAGAEAVICFCVSSKISASYQSALTACELLAGRDITVIDSNSLSMGQGFMVLSAAEAIAAGATKGQAIACAQDVRERTHLFAALSTLKYLAMSGRVGHLAAGLATLLDVKPILTIQNGKLDMLERVRTQKRAWSRVIELASQAMDGKTIERLAFLHVNAFDEARQLEQQLCANLVCPDSSMIVELTPGLSVHSGAGMVGVVLVTGK